MLGCGIQEQALNLLLRGCISWLTVFRIGACTLIPPRAAAGTRADSGPVQRADFKATWQPLFSASKYTVSSGLRVSMGSTPSNSTTYHWVWLDLQYSYPCISYHWMAYVMITLFIRHWTMLHHLHCSSCLGFGRCLRWATKHHVVLYFIQHLQGVL